VYNTHPDSERGNYGENCAYYIRIFVLTGLTCFYRLNGTAAEGEPDRPVTNDAGESGDLHAVFYFTLGR